MKILAFLLALALATTALLLPALAEEQGEKCGLTMYVWLQDMGIDFDGVLALAPTMEQAMADAKGEWEPDINHSFYYTWDGQDRYGHIWYYEDGSVHMIALYNLLADLYDTEGIPYDSDEITFIYDANGTGDGLVRVSVRTESQGLSVEYDLATGRMANYIYRPEDETYLHFNAYGAPDRLVGCDQEEIDRIERTYGMPTIVGDLYDFGDMTTFAPDVKVYAAFQDTGVDLPALMEAATRPEAGESETRAVDGAGNEICAQWGETSGGLVSLDVTFAEPLDGVWTGVLVQMRYGEIILCASGCEATYISTGELVYYTYKAVDLVWETFDADGTMWNLPTDNEAMLAMYTPLEVIPPSQDYSGDNVLGGEQRLTRAIYATLADFPMDLSAYVEEAAQGLGLAEQDGLLILPDKGYSQFDLDYLVKDAEQYDRVQGKRREDEPAAWVIDPSGAPWEQIEEVSLFAYRNDRTGDYFCTWEYPGLALMYEVDFGELSEDGYSSVSIYNGLHDLYEIRLFGEQAYATYDLEGNLTEYSYTEGNVTVRYGAGGELLRIRPEGTDPAGYPPLEIIGE